MSRIWHNDSPPWKETWLAFDADDDGDDFGIYRNETTGGLGNPAARDFVIENGMCPDDAVLAAAAPEMARLLLESRWFRYDEYRYPNETRCISCRETQERGCAANCKLVATLRKAGVLDP